MKNFLLYLEERFLSLFIFVAISSFFSAVTIYLLLYFFKIPETINRPFPLFLLLLLTAVLFIIFTMVDFKNFIKLKVFELSPEGVSEKLNDEIIKKSEEIEETSLYIKELCSRLTSLKHEKIKLEEKRAEVLKDITKI